MKKAITLLLSVILCLSFVSCGGGKERNLKESTIDSINEEIQKYEEFINANTS